MTPRFRTATLAASFPLFLAACGGGGEEPAASAPLGTAGAAAATTANGPSTISAAAIAAPSQSAPVATPVGAAIPVDRQRAARATAESLSNACAPIRPFYWEVGTRDGTSVSGSVSPVGSSVQVLASTTMSIASSSKWLYGAYVAERRSGALTAADQKLLTMRSGYATMTTCSPGQTVDSCLNRGHNGSYSPNLDGRFVYNSGHMQKHASLLGLGALSARALGTEMQSRLGTELGIRYSIPLLAGGANMSPASYAKFLRKIVAGELAISQQMGSAPACASASLCEAGEALPSPSPANERLHYSIGHWVEDDPVLGDGAFSSAGAFGFYPWIDAGRTTYGVVARQSSNEANAGVASMMCGRLIRKAWQTGVAM